MVNRKITLNQRINSLGVEGALLFTWIIPFLDCNGVFFGSPEIIKAQIFARFSTRKNKIEAYLLKMESLGLIIRYKYQGETYLFMPGFKGEQVGLRRDREEAEYPPPPADIEPPEIRQQSADNGGKKPAEGKLREGKLREGKLREGKGNPAGIPLISDTEDKNLVSGLNELASELCKATESLQGTPVTGNESEKIKQFVNDFHFVDGRYCPVEWIDLSRRRAIDQYKRSLNYMLGILKNWRDQGGLDPPGKTTAGEQGKSHSVSPVGKGMNRVKNRCPDKYPTEDEIRKEVQGDTS
jgi:DnaD/phage-associated family protein